MSETLESLGRIRAKGIGLLALVFVVGVVAGVAGDRGLRGRRPHFIAGSRAGRPLPPVLERLNLSDDQRRQIRALFDKTRPHTDSILRQYYPRLHAIQDSLNAQVRQILTPAQRDTLDRALALVRARGRSGWRPPGFGRPTLGALPDTAAHPPGDSR